MLPFLAARPFLLVSLFYAAYFAVPAVQLAFFPLWMQARGYDVVLIAYALALPWVLRPFIGPLLALQVDRAGGAGRMMALLFLAAVAGMGLVSLLESNLILVVAGLTFLMWSTALPLGEAAALRMGREAGFAYSHARLWGSISFVALTLAGGWAADAAGLGFVPLVLILSLLLCAVVSACFASPAPRPRPALSLADVGRLLRNPAYVFVVLAAAAGQATHAAYYAFGSVIWQSQGYSGTAIGLLWALGVVAEIVLFRYFPGEKWRAETLLVLGALAGLARWGLTMHAPPLALLAGLQLLHAFTFGATHLGAIHGVQRLAGPLQATGQTIYAVVQGLAMAFGMFLAGRVFHQVGAGVYAIMAGFSALALVFGLMAFRERAKQA